MKVPYAWLLAGLLGITFDSGTSFSQTSTLPSTQEFMNMLALCGAGSSIKFEGDLQRSTKSIYDQGRTTGKAIQDIVTAVMSQLPEKDRAAGLKSYHECIANLLKGPTKAQVQSSFLHRYGKDTPIAKVIEVFGQATKITGLRGKNGPFLYEGSPVDLLRFEGINFDFFVASNKKGHAFGGGVYAKKDPKLANVPYLGTFDNFHLSDLRDRCDQESIGISDARFFYMISGICDLGRPGGYLTYEFVFQLHLFDLPDCTFDVEPIPLKNMCKGLEELNPLFTVFYFTRIKTPSTQMPGGSLADQIIDWIRL